MNFQSILFDKIEDGLKKKNLEVPEFFHDYGHSFRCARAQEGMKIYD